MIMNALNLLACRLCCDMFVVCSAKKLMVTILNRIVKNKIKWIGKVQNIRELLY